MGLAVGRAIYRSMTQSHAVSALHAKRIELVRIIRDLRREIKSHQIELTHVDGALRLFEPDAPRWVAHPNRLFGNGELSQGCLRALRLADGPITATQLAQSFADSRQEALTNATVASVRRFLRVALSRRLVTKHGIGEGAQWMLAGELKTD